MTPAQLFASRPLAAVAHEIAVRNEEAFRKRCLAKMAEIVKAAKKGAECVVSDGDVSDISRFLRDIAANGFGRKMMSVMSKNEGFVHRG